MIDISLEVINNEWVLVLDVTGEQNETVLKTKDTFVDKNIKVLAQAAPGSVVIPNIDIPAQPEIVNNGNGFTINVSETAAITPEFTQGYISDINDAVVLVQGSIDIPETKLEVSMISASARPAGYSYRRTSATAGYNDDTLSNDLDVFQGNYTT